MRDGNFDVEQRVRTGSLCPGDPVGKRDGSGIALRRQLAIIGGSGRVP